MNELEPISQAFRELDDYIRGYEEKMRPLNGGPVNFWIQSMTEALESMFERFCPYRIGDRVQLKDTVVMDESNAGWHHCSHFLVAGAKGEVMSRTYRNGAFCFGVCFDDQSFKDMNGKLHGIAYKDRASFWFSEENLQN